MADEKSGVIYWSENGSEIKLSNGSQTAKRENERPSWSHRRQYVRANVSIPFGGSLTWEVDVENGDDEEPGFPMGVVIQEFDDFSNFPTKVVKKLFLSDQAPYFTVWMKAKEKIQMTISRNKEDNAISFCVDGGPLIIPDDNEIFKSFLKYHDSKELYPFMSLLPPQSATISLSGDSFIKPAKKDS